MCAALSLILVAINKKTNMLTVTDSKAVTDTLTVSNIFMGMMISFRLSSAFSQWRSGVNAIGAFAEAARTLMSVACANINVLSYEEEKNGLEDDEEASPHDISVQVDTGLKCQLLTELRRYVLLYVAIVFHDCRGLEDIELLQSTNLLFDKEYEELKASGAETTAKDTFGSNRKSLAQLLPQKNKLRAVAVELWMRRLIQEAQRKNFWVVAQSNVLNACITKLTEHYHTVYDVAHTPIPFSYAQFIKSCIVMYLFLYSCVIVSSSGWYSSAWVLAWGMVLFVADDVAIEIESPFGMDANDIDVEARMMKIENELTVLLRSQYHYGGVSDDKIVVRLRAKSSPTYSFSQKDFKKNDAVGKLYQSEASLNLPMQRTCSITNDTLPKIGEYTPLIVNAPAKVGEANKEQKSYSSVETDGEENV